MNIKINFGFIGTITLVLFILKAFNILSISWLIVFLPIILILIILFIILIIASKI